MTARLMAARAALLEGEADEAAAATGAQTVLKALEQASDGQEVELLRAQAWVLLAESRRRADGDWATPSAEAESIASSFPPDSSLRDLHDVRDRLAALR